MLSSSSSSSSTVSSLGRSGASMSSASSDGLPQCGPLLCFYWILIGVLCAFGLSLSMVLACVFRLRCAAHRDEAAVVHDEDDDSDATVALLVRYREQAATEAEGGPATPSPFWGRFHSMGWLPWRHRTRSSVVVVPPPEPPSVDDGDGDNSTGCPRVVAAGATDVATSSTDSKLQASADTTHSHHARSQPGSSFTSPNSQAAVCVAPDDVLVASRHRTGVPDACSPADLIVETAPYRSRVNDYEEPWQPIVVPCCVTAPFAAPKHSTTQSTIVDESGANEYNAAGSDNYLCDEVAPADDILYRGAMVYGWASAKNDDLIADDTALKDGWPVSRSLSPTRPPSEMHDGAHELSHHGSGELRRSHDRWIAPIVDGIGGI